MSAGPPTSVKIVVAGGLAVGKTTFIGSISQIEPMATEAEVSQYQAGQAGQTSQAGQTGNGQTTVAMDFGRTELPGNLWLYLFGTPGADRFLFLWDDLVRGALGALVLADTEHLEQCFPAIDYFEARQIPFVIAINCFNGVATHELDDVRDALAISDRIPLLYTDARSPAATRYSLEQLLRHAMPDVAG